MSPDLQKAVLDLIDQARHSASFIAEKTGWPRNDLSLKVKADRLEELFYKEKRLLREAGRGVGCGSQ